uniref:Uncharacterized protein n=1 Tax=Triticum urartu TaxID=4572 RepID=A0A8R7PHM3_TRIUA
MAHTNSTRWPMVVRSMAIAFLVLAMMFFTFPSCHARTPASTKYLYHGFCKTLNPCNKDSCYDLCTSKRQNYAYSYCKDDVKIPTCCLTYTDGSPA